MKLDEITKELSVRERKRRSGQEPWLLQPRDLQKRRNWQGKPKELVRQGEDKNECLEGK